MSEYISEAMPIHERFIDYESDFWGGGGFCDGYLKFNGNVIFIEGNNRNTIAINKFDGLLEVGHSDIATTYAHLFINKGQLARFPYRHKRIGLFMKINYEHPMQKIKF